MNLTAGLILLSLSLFLSFNFYKIQKFASGQTGGSARLRVSEVIFITFFSTGKFLAGPFHIC